MSAGMNGPGYRPLMRPMDFGEILDHSFKLFRHAWKQLITVGLLAAAPSIISSGLGLNIMSFNPENPTDSWLYRMGARAEMGDFTDIALFGGGILLVVLLSMLLYPLAQGAVVVICSRTYLGLPTTAGEALRLASRRYLPLLGTMFLTGLIALVGLPVFVLAGLLIFFFITVPAGYAALLTYSAFANVVVVTEEAGGGFAAIKRSFKLVSGRFWPLLGMGLLFIMMTGVVSSMVNFIVVMPINIYLIASGPNPVLAWLAAIIAGLATAVTTPFLMTGLTLAYYDTRVRKEGFDVELLAQSQLATPSEQL